MGDTTLSGFRFNTPTPLDISHAAGSCLFLQHSISIAEFETARASIRELSSERANWDGFGALPISDETKTNAITALDRLQLNAPAPSITLNPNGTLSFEWETDQGIGHLEIGRTRYSFYIQPNVGPAILLDGNAAQVYGLGGLITGRLYPKPSPPAYTKIQSSANV